MGCPAPAHGLPSYRPRSSQPDPGLTIVAGPNGAGKTNLLEAVHVADHRPLAPRRAPTPSWCATGSRFARVRLDLAGEDGGRPARRSSWSMPGETRAAGGAASG